jgi:FO synthase
MAAPMGMDAVKLAGQVLAGKLSDDAALALADVADTALLCAAAVRVRDAGFGANITYSRKVFIPLTQLCRDVCHYCTFAQPPRHLDAPYMSVEQVLKVVRAGADMGCKEVLLTLGERPELRYREAAEALAAMGFATTLDYVAHVAEAILSETGSRPRWG